MKCRLWTLAGVVACSFVFFSSAYSIATEPKQGWERFEFSGNTAFSHRQLRTALIAEPEFLLATHPNSDRSTVGQVAEQLLMAGYQNSGFKSPRFEFQGTSGGGGVISIDEGQRFRCGEHPQFKSRRRVGVCIQKPGPNTAKRRETPCYSRNRSPRNRYGNRPDLPLG
jgi:hypothetical protein